MVIRATAINPRLLRWAREQSGLEATEVAEALGKTPEAILSWEAGDTAPTWNQLDALATHYKRPVAIFFFAEPPQERSAETEFRTAAPIDPGVLDPDTRLAVRQGRAWQQSLRELAGVNPSDRFILRAFAAGPGNLSPEALAEKVRDWIGVTLNEQYRWRSSEIAFRAWRSVVEDVGVFVFKRSFKQTDVSGFCLHDEEFPIILINNSTAFARQTFTLFHELAHLLFRVSGITHEESTGILHASAPIEVACNRFATYFLVPDEGFPWEEVSHVRSLPDWIAIVAKRYSVSRLVILRRLRDKGKVDSETFRSLSAAWSGSYLARRAVETTGGSYYASQTTYLGDAYLELAFDRLHTGRISVAELADHLNVKARNIGKLEEVFLSRK
jgi:Zn-dependent peptidase ImmA (M78 family)/transcriptional regulator with XRE-family HTH domain